MEPHSGRWKIPRRNRSPAYPEGQEGHPQTTAFLRAGTGGPKSLISQRNPKGMNHQHRRLVTVLTVTFALLFAWSAWRPWHPQDWLLENVPVVAAVALAAWIYFRVPFSRSSWILVFLFLCFHEIGAHYTYSEVPWRQWLASLTGTEPIGGRNHFDRAVHFLYGFLLVVPLRELLSPFLRLPRVWSWLISMGCSPRHGPRRTRSHHGRHPRRHLEVPDARRSLKATPAEYAAIQ